MVKRIVYGVVLAGVLGLCYLGYNNYRQRHAMTTGEVLSGPSDSASPEPSVPLPSPGPASAPSTSAPPQVSSPAVPASQAPPAGDTMTPNPPNGMAYSGSGHFQVYRQGNLTYRINTDTGQTCVLYATNEEWRKPQVYSHGCGNSAAQ